MDKVESKVRFTLNHKHCSIVDHLLKQEAGYMTLEKAQEDMDKLNSGDPMPYLIWAKFGVYQDYKVRSTNA